MPAGVKEKYGEYVVSKAADTKILKYNFEDKMIKATWVITPKIISFELTNKTDHSIKIIWNDAAYIDIKGVSHRITHIVTKYDAHVFDILPQSPTVVPAKVTAEKSIIPIDHVHFSGFGPFRKLGVDPLLPTSGLNQDEADKNIKGKTMQVLLPLQIDDTTYEYTFIFKIDDVRTK
ncbi:MAG: hypothetical protein HY606_13480 [Planctomycetes bacterium]|nr:hypothetical protein [Planctomycetota bacterium]